MKELSTSIEVHAPASVVWRVLTDFDNYLNGTLLSALLQAPQNKTQS
jgi:hypothetical protein